MLGGGLEVDRQVLVILAATSYAVILMNSSLTYFLAGAGLPLHVGPHRRVNYADSSTLILFRDLAGSNYNILSV